MANHRFRSILMMSAMALVCGCASGLATGAPGVAGVASAPRAAREIPVVDSALDPAPSVSPAEPSPTARKDDQGDDPVGHVIVYPLVILTAIVLIGATVAIIGFVSGHH